MLRINLHVHAAALRAKLAYRARYTISENACMQKGHAV